MDLMFVGFVVARAESDSEAETVETADEASELGIVGDEAQDFGDGNFSPAPGVETVSIFPKNSARCEWLTLHAEIHICVSVVRAVYFKMSVIY